MTSRRVRLSKRLSYHLRHDPGAIGLDLDRHGWGRVDQLLDALERHGVAADRGALVDVVRHGDKPRFELSADGAHIRARYGHSIPIESGDAPIAPPPVLYHGTAERVVATILAQGLAPMGRRQVHLSDDVPTARQVGARHGRAVVLAVDAAAMVRDGATFRRPAAGVWLVDRVPPRYVRRLA